MKSFTWLCIVGTSMLLAGCASEDKHVFESTAHLPTTLSLQDTTNDTIFWKMDIPVAHHLKVDFDRPPEFEYAKINPLRPATVFKWSLYRNDCSSPVQSGRESLCGLPFLMKVSYRKSPELPDCLTDDCLQAPMHSQTYSAAPPQPAPQRAEVSAPQTPAQTSMVMMSHTETQPVHSHAHPPAAPMPVFVDAGASNNSNWTPAPMATAQPTYQQPAYQPAAAATPPPSAIPSMAAAPQPVYVAPPPQPLVTQTVAVAPPPAPVAQPLAMAPAPPPFTSSPVVSTPTEPQVRIVMEPVAPMTSVVPSTPAIQSVSPSIQPSYGTVSSSGIGAAVPIAQAPTGMRAIPLNVESDLLAKYSPASVSILIEGVPAEASLSAGRNNGAGIWTLSGDQVHGLHINVPQSSQQDIQLMIIATAPTANGDTASTVTNLVVKVSSMAAVSFR